MKDISDKQLRCWISFALLLALAGMLALVFSIGK